MGTAVQLLGKLAAGCAEVADDCPGRALTTALVASRIKAKAQVSGALPRTLRSAISLAGNPHMAGVASLFPLRRDLAREFRPAHLSDSTDLFKPSFDIRGRLYQSGLEAHLTFTVEQTAGGSWVLRQVTPTTGYPGLRIDDLEVIRQVATNTLQALHNRRLKSGLPLEPGILVRGSRVVEALRELVKLAA